MKKTIRLGVKHLNNGSFFFIRKLFFVALILKVGFEWLFLLVRWIEECDNILTW